MVTRIQVTAPQRQLLCCRDLQPTKSNWRKKKKKCASSNPANLLTWVEKSKVLHELFTSAMELDFGGGFYFLCHKREGEKPLRWNVSSLHLDFLTWTHLDKFCITWAWLLVCVFIQLQKKLDTPSPGLCDRCMRWRGFRCCSTRQHAPLLKRHP